MLALDVQLVLTQDNLRLAIHLGTVPDKGLDALQQLVLAHSIEDTDDSLRIDVGGNFSVDGEG